MRRHNYSRHCRLQCSSLENSSPQLRSKSNNLLPSRSNNQTKRATIMSRASSKTPTRTKIITMAIMKAEMEMEMAMAMAEMEGLA